MKRSATEIIRNLEQRIARLENRTASTQRKAGPGAGVEICLSGDSRNVRCLKPDVECNLHATVGRNGYPILHGTIEIEDVTIASYYNAKDIHGLVAVVDGGDINLDIDIDDEMEIESVEFTGWCELHNMVEGGGYSRGSAPKNIEVEGDIEVEITYVNGDYDTFEVPFTAYAKTSKLFAKHWETLDDVDEDEDYEPRTARLVRQSTRMMTASRREEWRSDWGLADHIETQVRNKGFTITDLQKNPQIADIDEIERRFPSIRSTIERWITNGWITITGDLTKEGASAAKNSLILYQMGRI